MIRGARRALGFVALGLALGVPAGAWGDAPRSSRGKAAPVVAPEPPDPAAVIPKTGADGRNALVDRLSTALAPGLAGAGGVPDGFSAPGTAAGAAAGAVGEAAAVIAEQGEAAAVLAEQGGAGTTATENPATDPSANPAANPAEPTGIVVEAAVMGSPAPNAPDIDRVVLTVRLDAAPDAPVGGARLLLVDGGAVFFGPGGGAFVPVPNQRAVVTPPGASVEFEVLPLFPAPPRPAAGTALTAGLTADPALLAVLRTVQRIEAEDVERLRRYVKPAGDGFAVETIVRNEDTRVAEWMVWRPDARGRPVGTLPRDAVRFAIFAVTAGYTIQDVADWLRTHRSLDTEPAIAAAREQVRQAEFVLERAALGFRTLGPRHAEFNFNRGVAAFEASDLARAEGLFRTAIELQATLWPAHYNLGVTLYRAGRYADASNAFLIASGIEGATAAVFFNRGATLFRMGDLAGAARQFRKALDLDGADEAAKAWLAKADPEGKTAPPPPAPEKKAPTRRGKK